MHAVGSNSNIIKFAYIFYVLGSFLTHDPTTGRSNNSYQVQPIKASPLQSDIVDHSGRCDFLKGFDDFTSNIVKLLCYIV